MLFCGCGTFFVHVCRELKKKRVFPPLKIFNQLYIPTHSMYGISTFIYLLKLPINVPNRPASLSGPGIG